MREIEFTTGEYYHVYNRGADKRRIFLTDSNYERFLESMYLFNDVAYNHSADPLRRLTLLASAEVDEGFREHLVEIIAFCLMPNHYHLLLRQIKEQGVSRFMHKLDQGYSRHFNLKNDRSGALYEGPFKAIHVDSDAYLTHLPVYIHLNAGDLFGIPWRDGLVNNWDEAVKRLEGYKWSSHGAYIGRSQYLPLIAKGSMSNFYRDQEDYFSHIKGWSGRELLGYPLDLVEIP